MYAPLEKPKFVVEAEARKLANKPTFVPVKYWRVKVLVVPPKINAVLFGELPYEETRTICGTDKRSAMKRAGIR